MPGIFKGNAQPAQPGGFKNFAIEAAPLFASLAAGYSSGRGPYAYLDQGIEGMQKRAKEKRDAEAAAAATAAFKGLMPGGMGAATTYGTKGGGTGGASGGYYASGPKYEAFPLGVDSLPQSPTTPGGYSMGTPTPTYIPEEVKNGIFAGESGGDYNALFGFSNRDGGQFSGAKLTDMTVDQALAFADPSGPYGQWVKGQIGRVATPMGAYQIVGTTLRAAKEGLGLTGNERMTPELQDQLGGWIYANQGTGAWEGYKGPQAAPEGGWGGSSVTMSAKGEGASPLTMGGPVDPMTDPYVQQLMTVMSMPGLSPEQQNVLQMQLQSRIQTITTPQPGAEEEAARARRARDAELLGYARGTPEFNQFVVTGEIPQAAKPIEVGGVLLDPVTREVIFDSRKPPEPEAPTTKNVRMADGTEVMVQWNPETKVWDAAPIPEGGTTGGGQKLTESQSKLTLFQTLQTETAPVLSELEKQFDPANLADPSLAAIPIAGNYFTSSQYQMYSTAAAAWAEGALRISTGAAATQPEIDRIVKVYFAQPGDTPETVAFKSRMREMYDRAVNNALGKPNGGGQLMLPDDFATGVMGTTATPSGAPAPGSVLKFDANGNIIP
jgi:hypothetical protein